MINETIYHQPHLLRNKNTLIIIFSHFSHDLCLGLLPALIPFIRNALELDYLQAGGLLAALMVTVGLSQFVGGWLGDRFPRRLLITIGIGGVGVCSFVVGLSGSYYILIVVFIAMGLFAGLYHPSGLALLFDGVESHKRGRAVAYHMVGGSVGFLIAPLLGGFIATVLGWQAAFMLLCIPAFLAVSVWLAFLPNSESQSDKKRPYKTDLRAVTSWHRLVTVSIMSILMEVVTGAAVAFFALFLVDVRGFTPGSATIGLVLLRSGGLVGSLIGGYFSDRWGHHRAVLLSFLAVGPTLLLLSYLTAVPFFIVLFFFGLFYIMREVSVQVYLLDETPTRFRSRLIGIYFGFGMEGSSLIQPLVGHAMDNFGIISVYIWLGAASTAISIAMPVLLFIRIRKSQQK